MCINIAKLSVSVLTYTGLLFHLVLFLGTWCLCCSMLRNFHGVCLKWRLHIFQVAAHASVWVHQWAGRTVCQQPKCRCIGICRNIVYSQMRMVNAWLEVAFPKCVITSAWDQQYVICKVKVFHWWLCQCNPLYAWRLPSCRRGRLWDLPI